MADKKKWNSSNDIWLLLAILFGLVFMYILCGGKIGSDDSFYCEEAYTNGQYYEQCNGN